MKNLIENLPDNINITVTKQDLIEFAEYLIEKFKEEVAKFSESNLYMDKDDGFIAPTAIYSKHEVAEILGVHINTITSLEKRGVIKCTRLGRRVLFLGEDIIRLFHAGNY